MTGLSAFLERMSSACVGGYGRKRGRDEPRKFRSDEGENEQRKKNSQLFSGQF